MTDSMIERVAKAMQLETVNKPFSWENAARAAINAMRIPTKDMIDVWRLDQVQSRSLETSYATMIDAALNECRIQALYDALDEKRPKR